MAADTPAQRVIHSSDHQALSKPVAVEALHQAGLIGEQFIAAPDATYGLAFLVLK